MRDLKDKSQITLIVQSLIVIVLFFICEMLFFTYLTKPTFYIIGIICLFLTLGLCIFFKFNLFSFKTLKWKELAIIIIGLLINEITKYLIIKFSSIPDNQNGLNDIVDQSNIFIAIMTLGIFIPVIEECIFRGILIKVMFQKKQWLGVIFSIILFTIAHNPTSVTEYIIYGIPAIIYSIIYYKTQRIELPIIIHVINNLLVFLN
ncbi:CPBP family intramembrane glutamic endopeptidase [Staphylococcus epidermidis]|uniref:CPBP family intramembrane glutamic endopeptidase n=1 Tax=Staphylococcus epidermidis TaxID=1282 RepID=UPI0021A841FE|nr:type II CAAX endopeptidase family protein [Staphylococcus epidermidis]MCT1660562.1 CPBP family intramembrane metalloprotease [Staphylococcus epidermidis]MDH9619344.1 type II CAAX endopeptidase family protein [Staphylococcus epidermidis]MDH9908308.1 type II CAAX endopeptidase family protein [Staphylococcus epidermidis]MDI0104892.1 type II CAAX endopeptidase family protein [Staphylococcus epidermidis]